MIEESSFEGPYAREEVFMEPGNFFSRTSNERPIAKICAHGSGVLLENRRCIARRVHGNRYELDVPSKSIGEGALDLRQGADLHGAARGAVREDEVHHDRAALELFEGKSRTLLINQVSQILGRRR